MQRRHHTFVEMLTHAVIFRAGFIALLLILIRTSLFAQTTEPTPLDIDSYTTLIDPENVGQLERLFVKRFLDYQWVDAFASDQSGHVVAALDNHAPLITVWDPATDATRQFDPLDELPVSDTYDPSPLRLAVSPDGTKLATSTYLQPNEAALQIVDIPTGNVVYTEVLQESYITNTSALEFSPDGTYLVASIGAHDITWWDVMTGSRVDTISYRDYDLQRTEDDFAPQGEIRDLVITSDNRVYFGQRGGIYEWNLETNTLERMYAMSNAMRLPDAPPDAMPRGLPAYPEFPADFNILAIAVSPDERYIVTGHRAGLLLWDTQHPAWGMSSDHWNDALARIAADDIEGVYGLTFDPAGDILLAFDSDTVFAISTETWELLSEDYYPSGVISGLALNKAGTLMYVGQFELGIALLAVADPDAPPFEMPPSTDPGGRCRIELGQPAYVYTLPIAREEYFYERLGPTRHVTLIGRLADNSWWQDNDEMWIASSAFGPGTIVTGDCDDLPVVESP